MNYQAERLKEKIVSHFDTNPGVQLTKAELATVLSVSVFSPDLYSALAVLIHPDDPYLTYEGGKVRKVREDDDLRTYIDL